MLAYFCVFLTFITYSNCDGSFLTSSYAQVSRAGSASDKIGTEGRSSGQTPWTQSSTAQVIRGQNLNSNHRYSNTKDSVVDKGVVIQERFNPRPWFAYEAIKGPAYIPPKPPKNQPDFTFDSFPPQLKPTNAPSSMLVPPFDSTDKPLDQATPPSEMDNFDDPPASRPSNTYGSPYNSYNPPAATSKPVQNYVTPPRDYLPPKPNYSPNDESLYLGPNKQLDDMTEPPDMKDPPEHPKHYGSQETGYSSDYLDHNPNDQMQLPPKDEEAPDYGEPHKHKDFFDAHIKHPDQYDDNGPPLTQTSNHPRVPSFSDPNESSYDNPGYPAPPPPSGDHLKLPAYLTYDPNVHGHSYHHYDHPPIYHEVKTTTPAAEDERLNKKPYSYYYLGRKLWYVPLYFSVYFIIYIFVLIIKSISRHKITFNHYFEDDKREMVNEHEEHVYNIDHHVHDGLDAARRKYIM